MPIQVQTPDGNIAQFPDGMSDAAISAVLAKEFPAPKAAPPPPPKPSTYADVIKSAASGLGQGMAGFVGLPSSAVNYVANKAGDLVGRPEIPDSDPRASTFMGIPTVGQANATIQGAFGKYHEPQTVPGQYARTIASFVPAAVFPGSAVSRAANVVIPAVTSETAGQFTQGTPYEPYARVAGAVVGGMAAQPVIRSINTLTSRLGAPIEDPEAAAQTMIGDAVRRDGGSQTVRSNLNTWRGNSDPALIDVTGNNVRRLVRSAASGGSGEAQNVATTYADRIAGNLQDNSLQLTRSLTPNNPESAGAYGAQTEDWQAADAQANYRQPYSQPAAVTPEMVDALQGRPGRSAIARALTAAEANRNTQQIAELRDLQAVAALQDAPADAVTGQARSIPEALSKLSAGSLDRVRIAMRETGRALSAKGANDIAGGYFGRMKDIDTALDQTPGLQDARASYADFGRQQDALELGQTGLNASPETYAEQLANLSRQSPAAPQAAGVGYRQALTDAISRPAEGSTGTLNRISTSTAQARNLGATFGDQAAQDYQTGIGNEIDRIKNARFINPNTGSQTELRLQDSGLLNLPTSSVGLIGRVWDKIRSSVQLTDQERTALVRLGTSEAKIVNLARANPSVTSRALTSALLGNSTARK